MEQIVVQESKDTISVKDQDSNLPVSISSESINVTEDASPLSVTTKEGDKLSVSDGDTALTIEEKEEQIQPKFNEVIQIIKYYSSDEEEMYKEEIDFVGDDLIYRGWANPGTATNSPSWRIRRTRFVGADDDVIHDWASGNTDFNKIWDDRDSYTYS